MFSFFGGKSSAPRASAVGSGGGATFIAPDTIKDSLKHISEDIESKNSLIDIATQILETPDEPAAAAASASPSASDDDKVRAFLNKVKSNPEYIQLLKDITRSTIEKMTTQSQNKEIAYIQLITRANKSDNKEPARRYMIQANMYFKSIGDEARARMFEGTLEEFMARVRERQGSRADTRGSRKTRRLHKRRSKQTKRVRK